MPLTKSAMELITPIERFGSMEEADQCLRYWAAKFEIEHIAYLAHLNLNTACVVTTFPNAWVNRYMSKNYMQIDPVVEMACNISRPFFWGECYSDDIEISEFFADSIAHGLGPLGAAIPIHGSDGDKAIISFASNLSGPKWKSFCARTMGQLSLFALQFHMAAINVRGALLKRPQLKTRELEILSWAAEGKTAWEIGKILNVSEKTIENILKSVREKFNAANTTHAISLAFRSGILR